MCLKTHYRARHSQESFLRKNYLFEMLICEIYNLLTLYRPQSLTSMELFDKLSPFLKSRILLVMKQDEAIQLFTDKNEIIEYVADLLSDKVYKIHFKNDSYYCEIETQ